MKLIRQTLGTLAEVLGDGLLVLARHWPALLGWFLVGATGRRVFLWLAVWLSSINRTAGVLVLPLAPICTLLSWVMMLRCTASSLPAFETVDQASRREAVRTHLAVAAEVLVPFLAIYASQGLLKADTRAFIVANTADEWLNKGFGANFARSLIGPAWVLATLVVLALVVRKAIAGFGLAKRSPGWSALSGYVETLWMMCLGTVLTTRIDLVREWVTTRAVIVWALDQYHRAIAWFGPIGTLFDQVMSTLNTILSSMSTLVIVPVAWLAIGAAVYGSKIPDGGLPAPERRTQQLQRIPQPVRRVVAQGLEPVTTPVRETATAISRVASAGIVPMVLFCLVFVLAGSVTTAVAELERTLLGARKPQLRDALVPHLELVQQAVYFTLAMGLLAAAVNHVVGSSHGPEPEVVPTTEAEMDAEPVAVPRRAQLSGSAT